VEKRRILVRPTTLAPVLQPIDDHCTDCAIPVNVIYKICCFERKRYSKISVVEQKLRFSQYIMEIIYYSCILNYIIWQVYNCYFNHFSGVVIQNTVKIFWPRAFKAMSNRWKAVSAQGTDNTTSMQVGQFKLSWLARLTRLHWRLEVQPPVLITFQTTTRRQQSETY
jgi:hypothetical protein